MGRLDRYQKKQQKRQIFFAVGVLIVVVILLFSYGIPLILNTSLFIAHLTEPKVTPSELEKNENFFGNVDISSIPSATNSAKIEVGGSAVNFTDLEFYLNDDDQVFNVLRTQIDVILPSGVAVLNAADARVVEMAPLCDGTIIFYGESSELPAIVKHRADGGRAVFLSNDLLTLATGNEEVTLPALGARLKTGREVCTESILAAAAAAWALDIPMELMTAGIETFDAEQSALLAYASALAIHTH